jgi:hypothetical protein
MSATSNSLDQLTGWTNTGRGAVPITLESPNDQMLVHDGVVWLGLSVGITATVSSLSPPWNLYFLMCRSTRPGSTGYGNSRFYYRADASSYGSFDLDDGGTITVQGQAATGAEFAIGEWQRVRVCHNGANGFIQIEDAITEVNTGSAVIDGALSLFSYSPGVNGIHAWLAYVNLIPGELFVSQHNEIWAAMAARAAELPWYESELITEDGEHNGFPGYCILSNGSEVVAYRVADSHTSNDGIIQIRTRANSSAAWGSASTLHDPSASSLDGRDPSIYQLASGRVLIVGHDRDGVAGEVDSAWCYYSDDNCGTWSAKVTIPDIWDGTGKPEAPPVETGGVVKLPIGKGSSPQHIGLAISEDEGETWSTDDFVEIAQAGDADLEEPNMIVRAGEHVVIARGSDENTRLFTSANGTDWTARGIVYQAQSRSALVELPLSGNIVAIYRKATGTGFCDLMYRKSTDNGRTWGDEVCIKPHHTSNDYAAAVMRSDNTLCGVASFLFGAGKADIHYFERNESDL